MSRQGFHAALLCPRPRRSRLMAVSIGVSIGVSIAVLATVVTEDSTWARIDDDVFTSGKPWYIRISSPADWKMSEQTSYTSLCVKAGTASAALEGGERECSARSDTGNHATVLLWMHRRNPQGKMILAAERLNQPAAGGQRITSRAYAERTKEVLTELGFEVRTPQLHAATGAHWIEFDNGAAFMRQALLVAGSTGFSLTLAAPDDRTRTKHLRAFDYALRSIRIDRSDGGGRGAGAAKSGDPTTPAGDLTTPAGKPNDATGAPPAAGGVEPQSRPREDEP